MVKPIALQTVEVAFTELCWHCAVVTMSDAVQSIFSFRTTIARGEVPTTGVRQPLVVVLSEEQEPPPNWQETMMTESSAARGAR